MDNIIIKVTTDNIVSAMEFKDNHIPYKELCKLVHDKCVFVEKVYPRNLYLEWNFKRRINKTGEQVFVMLIDDEAIAHSPDMNILGSLLYDTQNNGNPIHGTILFAAEEWIEGKGYTIVGIREREESTRLLKLINRIVDYIRDTVETKQ